MVKINSKNLLNNKISMSLRKKMNWVKNYNDNKILYDYVLLN